MAIVKLKVTTNMEKAAKDIKNFGKLTQTEFRRIQRAQEKVSTEKIESFAQKTRRAGIALSAIKGKTVGYREENFRLQRKIRTLINDGMDPLDKRLQKLSRRYEENQKAIAADTRAQKASEDAMQASKIAVIALGAAIVATSAFGTKSQAEYKKEIANVNTLLEITDSEFKNLDRTIEGLSNRFAIHKKQLTSGIYQAVSAGAVNLGEALTIVEDAAILGKAALVDNREAVDILTTAMNAYGKGVISSAKASNIFFQIIKKGKITGAELSATIGQSIPLFAGVGLSMEDLGAGLSTMTKIGVKASVATTQLNAIVNAFIKPSEDMTAALERQGFASGSALLESEGLAGALAFLKKETGGSKELLAKLLPNIRAIRGALALAAQESGVFADAQRSFTDVTGVTNEALKRQTEGFAKNVFTVEQSIVALTNLSMQIGDVVLPVLGKTAKLVTDMTTAFGDVSPKASALRTALFGIGLTVAPMLAMAALPAIITGVSAAWGVLTIVMAANPLGAIAITAISLTTALTSLAAAILAGKVAAAEASGTFAAMGNEGLAKVSEKLEEYQLQMRNAATMTSEQFKKTQQLKAEIEALTGGVVKLSDATREDGSATKEASIVNHGMSQTVESLNKRVATSILLAKKGKAATDAKTKKEKEAARIAAELFKKEHDRILAKEKAEKEALTRWKAGLKVAKQTRKNALIDFARISMTASEVQIDIIDKEFEKKSSILKTFFASDTEALVALQRVRNAKVTAVKLQAGQDQGAMEENRIKESMSRADILEARKLEIAVAGFDAWKNLEKKKTALLLEQELLRRQWIASSAAIALSIAGMVDGFFQSTSDNKIAKIDLIRTKELDALSETAQAEIAAIRASTLSRTKQSLAIIKVKADESKAIKKIDRIAAKAKHKQALADWKRSIAMIQVHAAVGAIKVWADPGYPMAIPLTVAIGAAQTASTAVALKNKPVLSAQTGITDFTVPEVRGINRSDGVGISVNPGEKVTVEPRSEESGRETTVVVQLNDQVLWRSMQRGIDGSHVTFTDENLRRVG